MPANAALLAARLLLAFLFVSSGLSALGDILATAAYFAGLGFPAPTLVAGRPACSSWSPARLILVGFKTRIAALLLALSASPPASSATTARAATIPTLAFMHSQALMKDIAIAGGFLALAIAGPGAWSVDGRAGEAET